jgi:hypothetical protein
VRAAGRSKTAEKSKSCHRLTWLDKPPLIHTNIMAHLPCLNIAAHVIIDSGRFGNTHTIKIITKNIFCSERSSLSADGNPITDLPCFTRTYHIFPSRHSTCTWKSANFYDFDLALFDKRISGPVPLPQIEIKRACVNGIRPSGLPMLVDQSPTAPKIKWYKASEVLRQSPHQRWRCI